MPWKQLRPVRGAATRITGPVVTIGKTGHLHFSPFLAEQLDMSDGNAASVHWNMDTHEIAIIFVAREGRGRSELYAEGLLAVNTQGRSYHLTAKNILRTAGISIPIRAVRFDAEIRDVLLDVGQPKQKAVVVGVGDLMENASEQTNEEETEA